MHHVQEKVFSVRTSLVRVRLALMEMDTIVHRVSVSEYRNPLYGQSKVTDMYDKQ